MTDIDRNRVDHVLELICENGCVRVRAIIGEIRQGEIPVVATQLNQAERALLLEELVSVMDTYQGSCQT